MGVEIFLAIVLVILAIAFFFPGAGILARLSARRASVSSDREMGTGDLAGDQARPEHKGPVPEQEEREKGTLFPSS
jgi:hypothetical protein